MAPVPTTANADLAKAAEVEKRTALEAVPVNYLETCGPIPELTSGEIEDVKRAYKRTQSDLVRQCTVHDDLVKWLLRRLSDEQP